MVFSNARRQSPLAVDLHVPLHCRTAIAHQLRQARPVPTSRFIVRRRQHQRAAVLDQHFALGIFQGDQRVRDHAASPSLSRRERQMRTGLQCACGWLLCS